MTAVERVREAVLIALDQIRANKFRSVITILGIVIGVGTVMIMSAMIAGIRAEVVADIEAAGPKAFIVARYDFSEIRLDHEWPPWGTNPEVRPAEAARLASLSTVRRAVVDVDGRANVKAGRGMELESVPLTGSGEGWDDFRTGRFVSGSNFRHSDVVAVRPVAVVTSALADAIFGQLEPVGRTVRLNGRPFTVVGVYEPAENLFGEQNERYVVVPYTTALRHLGAWRGGLQVLVVPQDAATQQQAIDQVVGALRSFRGLRPADPDDFAVVRQQQALDTFNRVTTVFFVVMLGLSSVALLVGGVGVIAIMMISVSERTREIGIRKALGARRGEILWQFLFEAATLTVAGAAAGLVLGGGLAVLVRAVTPVPATIQLWAVVAALAMAALAGIVFGLLPAWRASRLDPVVALRYE